MYILTFLELFSVIQQPFQGPIHKQPTKKKENLIHQLNSHALLADVGKHHLHAPFSRYIHGTYCPSCRPYLFTISKQFFYWVSLYVRLNEQPLRGMELQEQEEGKYEKHLGVINFLFFWHKKAKNLGSRMSSTSDKSVRKCKLVSVI